MKLYYTPGACSMASHIMLNELGINFTKESVDLKTHKTASGKDFYSINPKGYVPALVLDNGKLLTENIAILSYLTDLKPVRETLERYEFLEWLAFVSTEVHKTLGSLFAIQEPSVVNAIKDKAAKRLEVFDKHLADREYVLGHDFSAIDAYLFTVLGWCPHLGIDLSRWKNLSAFVQRIKQRPAVQKTMKDEGLL